MNTITRIFIIISICSFFCFNQIFSKENNLKKNFQTIDERVQEIVDDWNIPGCAIGIVKGSKLVYAKGFGYRDVENKLPVTPNTQFAIGSNTKLFTAIAAGFLVEEELLEWDKPIKEKVQSIQFYNNHLNNSITLRDMLGHRTGLSSPDGIWFYSDFTRQELFERIKYCKPENGFREVFNYNNFMYMAVGEIIHLVANQTWEEFIREKIFNPLDMTLTNFSIEDMLKGSDCAKPYKNNYLDNEIIPINYNKQLQGIGPAGSINSSVNEMANWVICQLSTGQFKNDQVIPSSIINETLKPSMISGEWDARGKEFSTGLYGMGRFITTYKGHSVSEHAGGIDGFLSRVTIFPEDSLGIIILYNTHTQPLRNFLQYEIADRMLDLELTDWHGKTLEWRKNNIKDYKKWLNENKPTVVQETKPSHKIQEYNGVYENEIYGNITIKIVDETLRFNFYNFDFPLNHVHFDQFETDKHEQYGKYILMFLTNSLGQIDRIQMKLDDPNTIFRKKIN